VIFLAISVAHAVRADFQHPTAAARSRHGILHAMNTPRRLAILGVVIVAAIALAASLFYVVRMTQLNAPVLGTQGPANSPSSLTAQQAMQVVVQQPQPASSTSQSSSSDAPFPTPAETPEPISTSSGLSSSAPTRPDATATSTAPSMSAVNVPNLFITSINPTSGSPGTVVTLFGTYFGSGALAVDFDCSDYDASPPCNFRRDGIRPFVVSTSSLAFRVPADAPIDTYFVGVEDRSAGELSSSTLPITFTVTPTSN
jgi:hypothetical protein